MMFEIYIDDDRYSVPTLHFIAEPDAAAAVRAAESLLFESRHHRGVEVWSSNERVFAVSRSAKVAR